MKLTTVLASAAMLGLVYTSGYAGSLDVPDDLKAAVNQIEFVAHIALRCDIALTVHGLKGAYQEDCTSFVAQVPIAIDTWEVGSARWITLETAVGRSSNGTAKLEWRLIGSRMTHHMDQITKTMDHLKFLTNAKKATIKGAKR